jgi:hypothetical protein
MARFLKDCQTSFGFEVPTRRDAQVAPFIVPGRPKASGFAVAPDPPVLEPELMFSGLGRNCRPGVCLLFPWEYLNYPDRLSQRLYASASASNWLCSLRAARDVSLFPGLAKQPGQNRDDCNHTRNSIKVKPPNFLFAVSLIFLSRLSP